MNLKILDWMKTLSLSVDFSVSHSGNKKLQHCNLVKQHNSGNSFFVLEKKFKKKENTAED